jgi:hypothetical protein
LTGGERRAASRISYRDGFLPPPARIRPGRLVTVVNLSCRGALVEGVWRLKPGSRVAFFVRPREAVLVEARVTRCYVARLEPYRPVRYRVALAFERTIPVPTRTDLRSGYETPLKFPSGVAEG